MSGNVCEWCADKADPKKKGDDVPRVLRGGSWIRHQDPARASSRYDYDPDDRHYGIGFRLLFVSPIC